MFDILIYLCGAFVAAYGILVTVAWHRADVRLRELQTRMVKPKDAAVRLGVSAHTVRRMVKDGRLPGMKVGRQYRVRPEGVR